MTPEDVLQFWFGPPAADESELMNKTLRWFGGGPDMDAEVIARFGDAVHAALDGRLDAWRETARGRLALVILLDQFTRNVFRDSPRMYAGDARAQELALEAFAGGSAAQLGYVEQMFLSLPLLHSESPGHQARCREIATAIAADAPPLCRLLAAMHLEQSAKYSSVIARFGRFPHRNALLGRTSMPAEVEFLADWEAKAPPAGMPKDGGPSPRPERR